VTQMAQLLPGVVVGVPHGDEDTGVAAAIRLQTVRMNLRARHGQLDFHHVGRVGDAIACQALQRHMASADVVLDALQSGCQIPSMRFEGRERATCLKVRVKGAALPRRACNMELPAIVVFP